MIAVKPEVITSNEDLVMDMPSTISIAPEKELNAKCSANNEKTAKTCVETKDTAQASASLNQPLKALDAKALADNLSAQHSVARMPMKAAKNLSHAKLMHDLNKDVSMFNHVSNLSVDGLGSKESNSDEAAAHEGKIDYVAYDACKDATVEGEAVLAQVVADTANHSNADAKLANHVFAEALQELKQSFTKEKRAKAAAKAKATKAAKKALEGEVGAVNSSAIKSSQAESEVLEAQDEAMNDAIKATSTESIKVKAASKAKATAKSKAAKKALKDEVGDVKAAAVESSQAEIESLEAPAEAIKATAKAKTSTKAAKSAASKSKTVTASKTRASKANTVSTATNDEAFTISSKASLEDTKLVRASSKPATLSCQDSLNGNSIVSDATSLVSRADTRTLCHPRLLLAENECTFEGAPRSLLKRRSDADIDAHCANKNTVGLQGAFSPNYLKSMIADLKNRPQLLNYEEVGRISNYVKEHLSYDEWTLIFPFMELFACYLKQGKYGYDIDYEHIVDCTKKGDPFFKDREHCAFNKLNAIHTALLETNALPALRGYQAYGYAFANDNTKSASALALEAHDEHLAATSSITSNALKGASYAQASAKTMKAESNKVMASKANNVTAANSNHALANNTTNATVNKAKAKAKDKNQSGSQFNKAASHYYQLERTVANKAVHSFKCTDALNEVSAKANKAAHRGSNKAANGGCNKAEHGSSNKSGQGASLTAIKPVAEADDLISALQSNKSNMLNYYGLEDSELKAVNNSITQSVIEAVNHAVNDGFLNHAAENNAALNTSQNSLTTCNKAALNYSLEPSDAGADCVGEALWAQDEAATNSGFNNGACKGFGSNDGAAVNVFVSKDKTADGTAFEGFGSNDGAIEGFSSNDGTALEDCGFNANAGTCESLAEPPLVSHTMMQRLKHLASVLRTLDEVVKRASVEQINFNLDKAELYEADNYKLRAQYPFWTFLVRSVYHSLDKVYMRSCVERRDELIDRLKLAFAKQVLTTGILDDNALLTKAYVITAMAPLNRRFDLTSLELYVVNLMMRSKLFSHIDGKLLCNESHKVNFKTEQRPPVKPLPKKKSASSSHACSHGVNGKARAHGNADAEAVAKADGFDESYHSFLSESFSDELSKEYAKRPIMVYADAKPKIECTPKSLREALRNTPEAIKAREEKAQQRAKAKEEAALKKAQEKEAKALERKKAREEAKKAKELAKIKAQAEAKMQKQLAKVEANLKKQMAKEEERLNKLMAKTLDKRTRDEAKVLAQKAKKEQEQLKKELERQLKSEAKDKLKAELKKQREQARLDARKLKEQERAKGKAEAQALKKEVKLKAQEKAAKATAKAKASIKAKASKATTAKVKAPKAQASDTKEVTKAKDTKAESTSTELKNAHEAA